MQMNNYLFMSTFVKGTTNINFWLLSDGHAPYQWTTYGAK